jgi:hypothetical protein
MELNNVELVVVLSPAGESGEAVTRELLVPDISSALERRLDERMARDFADDPGAAPAPRGDELAVIDLP